MITSEMVKEAIGVLLEKEFPGVEVHVDLMPANFTRPAFFLELFEVVTADVNCNTVEETLRFRLTHLANLDCYGDSADNDLALVGEAIRELFRGGVLAVADRMVRCSVKNLKDVDRAQFDITIIYWEARRPPEQLPTMGSINITQKGVDNNGTSKH